MIRYIGYTTRSLTTRLNEHKSTAKKGVKTSVVYNWMRKHGVEDIEMTVLETETMENIETLTIILHMLERLHILEATRLGWDLVNTEDGGQGHPQHTGTRDKISNYVRENHPMQGKTHTEEARAKIREARAKQTFSEESNKKRRDSVGIGVDHPMYGKTHTPEARAKMSENMKGRVPWNKGMKTGAKWTRPKIFTQGNHTRHHTMKNIINTDCTLCTVETLKVGQNV